MHIIWNDLYFCTFKIVYLGKLLFNNSLLLNNRMFEQSIIKYRYNEML